MTYQPGERVALVHTSDPHTLLRPGDEGAVRRYDPQQRVLDVDWDSGSRLAVVLDAGDRIRRVPAAGTSDTGWERVLDALRAAGAEAGQDAARWWAQHVLGGRATGDRSGVARQVLAGIDDVDPPVVDGLPATDRYVLAEDGDRYAEHAPHGAPEWGDLTARQCDQTRWAWCDGFDDAAEAEVARQCRMILHPSGDDRDMSHVHPDRVRLGGPGVFAGDWAWTPNADGQMRIPVGFAGTLVDTWNGWAVFTCTRLVAEVIVAEQQDARDRYRRELAAQGITGARRDRMVDESLARMRFDGDVIDVDETRVYGDPEAVSRVAPDPDGRYTVMGRAWTWTPVHPYDCDRIAGDIPDPAAVHCVNLRCAVARVTPNDASGSFHQEQPAWVTYTIAASTARSSTRRRPPPCRRTGAGGINGAAISHRSSGAQVRIMASSTEADHARAKRSSK